MVKILLAGTAVQFENTYPELEWMCRGYETELPPEITIRVSEEELAEERKKQDGTFSDGYVETVCCYRKAANRLLDKDTFVLHASVVELDGAGYAFLAPSGGGKTTQTRLWKQYFGKALRVINGDKPLIRMETREGAVQFRAYGTPWQGKEGMGCNGSAPLKALFFLEQSKCPSVTPAEEGQTVERLFRQLLMPKEPQRMDRLLTMADGLICQVPAYILSCDMTGESVRCAYQGIKGGKQK